MRINYMALANFRYEILRFLNFSEKAARRAGIEPRQHQALLAIKGLPDPSRATVGVLAERLQIRHHSAVELSRRLEAKKLISRVRTGDDRRQVHLRLTLRGEKLLRDLSATHGEELRTAGPRLIAALTRAVRGQTATRKRKKLAAPRAANRASRQRKS